MPRGLPCIEGHHNVHVGLGHVDLPTPTSAPSARARSRAVPSARKLASLKSMSTDRAATNLPLTSMSEPGFSGKAVERKKYNSGKDS